MGAGGGGVVLISKNFVLVPDSHGCRDIVSILTHKRQKSAGN